jgi:hypothetical protein
VAVKFETIKDQILVVLYDYMLTSDSDAFWYSINAISVALEPNVSGAFVRRAIDALVEDETVEQGVGDPEDEAPGSPVFALTQDGIEAAEEALERRGWDLKDYQPAPSVDRIISRANEPELHAEIHGALQEIAKGVRESNEAGELLGDDKTIIWDELETAVSLSGKDRFRLQRLTSFILPTLQFVASKFLGSAIGEAAKHLVNLLLKLP